MKAVILAAGLGTRLRPITKDKPKSLVQINGTSLLENQINSLDSRDMKEIVVVTGYMNTTIEEFLDDIKIQTPIRTVHNEEFNNTDNLYSFLLTEEYCSGEELLLMNGDIFVRENVFQRLIETEGSLIACDFKEFDREAMKVIGERENLESISKDIEKSESTATSIDMYKFSEEDSTELYNLANEIFEPQESQWTELAINDLLKDSKIRSHDIGSEKWSEIDNIDDLLNAEKKFSKIEPSKYEKFIFDLDGTIYLDEESIEGSVDLVNQLKSENKEVKFISNNSSNTNEKYRKKLEAIGVKSPKGDVLISTDMVISHLENEEINEAFILGTREMKGKLEDNGIAHSESADVVVSGFDKDLNYEKVQKACLLIQDGAEFLLAHKDLKCPTKKGFIPDAGAIGELVSLTTDQDPDKVFGKPTDEMVEFLDSDKRTLVVGDRLETDIKLGKKMKADTILVLTGDSTRADVEKSNLNPDLVLRNIGELRDLI